MILPDLVLKSRADQQWDFSGIDCWQYCKDKNHFLSYPYSISYNFNSRGFRDCEWPVQLHDLKQSIWCLGDSFTVGIGSPAQHTWPRLLEARLNKRCINVSMDGASNHWIFDKAKKILDSIQPNTLVLHWSYTWRTQDPDQSKSDEDRRRPFFLDLETFDNIPAHIEEFNGFLSQLANYGTGTKIIHTFIPRFSQVCRVEMSTVWKQLCGNSWPELPENQHIFDQLDTTHVDELINFGVYENFKNHYKLYKVYNKLCHVPEFDHADWARDGHHYDKITAERFIDALAPLI